MKSVLKVKDFRRADVNFDFHHERSTLEAVADILGVAFATITGCKRPVVLQKAVQVYIVVARTQK